MKTKKLLLLFKSLVFGILMCSHPLYAHSGKIDPVRFTVSTEATYLNINEEFEIKITARYLSLNPNIVYVFDGSNAFKLKLIAPEGFKQTGGTYSDFVGAELTSSKPSVTYTVKGKFISDIQSGTFQLLRSHKNADAQSAFVQVGTLAFSALTPDSDTLPGNNARIAVVNPDYIPYMTMGEFRAGAAGDSSDIVYINEGDRSGIFTYNAANLTSPDDSSMVLRNGNKRYVRRFSGPVNVKWFGAVADFITSTQSGTDNTYAFAKATNYAVNNRIATLLVPAGRYGLRYYTIRNVNIKAVGKVAFSAMASSYPYFFTLQEGSVTDITLGGFRLDGNLNNTNQVGLDITAKISSTEQTGGLWYSRLHDMNITTFPAGAMKFVANDPTVNGKILDVANQFLVFDNVKAFRINASSRALYVNGQFGQVIFNNCEFDGPAGDTLVNATNVELISPTLTSQNDEVYSVDFNTCTFQNGDKGVRTRYVKTVNFNGCHWENLARPVYTETGSIVNVTGNYFAACGAGNRIKNAVVQGSLIYIGTTSRVSIANSFSVGSVDFTAVGSNAHGLDFGSGNELPSKFQGLSFQTSVSSEGVLELYSNKARLIVNASAVILKTINSKVGIGDELLLESLGDITLDNTGNIVIPGNLSNIMFRSGQIIKLRFRSDKWVLLNASDAFFSMGSGSPQNALAGRKGAIYLRTDGGDTIAPVYIKTAEVVAGDKTGWVPLATRVGGSDIEFTSPAVGNIYKSPNGTRYRVTVSDTGSLITTVVP